MEINKTCLYIRNHILSLHRTWLSMLHPALFVGLQTLSTLWMVHAMTMQIAVDQVDRGFYNSIFAGGRILSNRNYSSTPDWNQSKIQRRFGNCLCSVFSFTCFKHTWKICVCECVFDISVFKCHSRESACVYPALKRDLGISNHTQSAPLITRQIRLTCLCMSSQDYKENLSQAHFILC